MDEYSGLSDKRLWQILLEIWDMDDDYLMEEVFALDYEEYEDVNNVAANYIKNGGITEEERQKAIAFYILTWYDDEVED